MSLAINLTVIADAQLPTPQLIEFGRQLRNVYGVNEALSTTRHPNPATDIDLYFTVEDQAWTPLTTQLAKATDWWLAEIATCIATLTGAPCPSLFVVEASIRDANRLPVLDPGEYPLVTVTA